MVNVAIATCWLSPPFVLPVLVGAVIPDLPIVVLYLRERYLRGMPDEHIWAESYQRPFWLNLIHGAHSIPLALGGALVSLALGAPGFAAFFASVLFHCVLDLPLHGEDAHRHFLPLSHYRLISPISYWDVRHHARSVVVVETLVVAFAAWVLFRRTSYAPALVSLVAVVAWYVFTSWRYRRT